MVDDIDLSFSGPGMPWFAGRTYNHRQYHNSAYYNSDGPQGKNWFQSSAPEIRFHDDATNTNDVVYLILGADRYLEFRRYNSTSNTFKGTNGAAGIIQFAAGSGGEPETYTYYDPTGHKVVFFGFDTNAAPCKGQFWRLEDAAGNKVYAGHATTGSTAITSGYGAGGELSKVYDSAERRWSYTVSATGGRDRYTQIKVETKTGGTWS